MKNKEIELSPLAKSKLEKHSKRFQLPPKFLLESIINSAFDALDREDIISFPLCMKTLIPGEE